MSAARPDGGNAKRKWAREMASGMRGGVEEAGGLGPGGREVEPGLQRRRSNNAVKAFLNIVNIPKPAEDEAISGERCPRARRVIQVYAAATKLPTLEI